jgi:ELWxxDGT repeat protein
MRPLVLSLLFSLIAPLTIHAQSAYLVKDINAITSQSPRSSSPSNFFRYGSRVFFAATTPGSGVELWSTDGTAAGTAQVADINPGSAPSNPYRFVIVNGKLLFNARDFRGEELWTTDGTSAGTRLLADINSGSSLASSSPGDRIVYHGQMIFSADDGIDGNELWITDGTSAGTRFFKDLAPGPYGSYASSFVLLNDLVYFGTSGGLWKTDGTEAGTVMVKAVDVSTTVTVAGSQLFFPVFDPQTNYNQPWVSDGTEAGTHMIMEFSPPPTTALKSDFTAFGDRVLFVASDPQHGEELWISDGTAAGTHILRDINPGPSDSVSDLPFIAVAGGVAYFTAYTAADGHELWKTDGTEAGTVLVRDISPGSNAYGPNGSAPNGLTVVGDKVFFSATSGGDRTLWSSDGTATGTIQVKTSGRLILANPVFTNIDGILYFAGSDPLNGTEPWKSDGTDGGTSMIANLASDAVPSSDPRDLVAAGDWIYFTAWDGLGPFTSPDSQQRSLWRSDGTPEGTLKLTDGQTSDYTPVGRSLFFTKGGLWMSDGTPEGTAPATAFVNRFPGPPLIRFVMGDKIFAIVGDALWITTTSPNALAVPLGVSIVYGFVNVAGRALFIGNGMLWTSDGTPAGTYTVATPPGSGVPSNGVVMGGYAYFTSSVTNGTDLWKSDGTFEGTVVVKVLSPSVGALTPAGRDLFFTVGAQLWVSDGTDAGTRALPATPNGTLAVTGNGVVFVESDSTSGFELWGSDGTAEGTHLVRDIYPGPNGSFLNGMTSVDGMVFFTATDGVHGSEVWVTDGTSEGTKLAADVEPGFNGSFPQLYVKTGNRLFFAAMTSATGNELWALPFPATPRLTINDIRVAEGDTGTTAARFTVTLSAASAQTVTVDYLTSDGTATAGSDYDAASGSLTFAAGETSKNIDVPVRGDVTPENNETFFVNLRNAAGATIVKPSGFAVIDDDDQAADVAATLDFSLLSNFDVMVNAANSGPRTATGMKVLSTATPAGQSTSCYVCPKLVQLVPGAKAQAFDYRWSGYQQYLTVTITAAQTDPQPSNNSVGWMTHDFMAMDALSLVPGSQANVWFFGFDIAGLNVESSNPAVISVPSTLTSPSPATAITFVAHGLSVGTATIRIFTPTSTFGTLMVDVVAPGTKLRWPGAVNAFPENSRTRLDVPLGFRISTIATAPYTGQTATGLVTITENGQELERTTLTPGAGTREVLAYFPAIGANSVRMDYAGDANFLPMTQTWSINVETGFASIIAGAARSGTTATVHVRVAGSPQAAPTGSITISEPGVIPARDVVLTAAEPGVSQADFSLTNVSSGQHTLLIAYSGDARYNPGTQGVRVTEARERSVRH